MSIFKVKEWWSTKLNVQTEVDGGLFNEQSLLLANLRLNNIGDDFIVVGDCNGSLKIYKPEEEYKPTDLFLEFEFGQPILQISVGKFTSLAESPQLIVLHPDKCSIFNIHLKPGISNAGDQYCLQQVITNNLLKSAFNMVLGHFGGVKSRELVCIQSIDCFFTFYDQELCLFTLRMSDMAIPTPFVYVGSSDCFVTVKSNWIMEIYSYQKLLDYAGVHSKQRIKKLNPHWLYNCGEEIMSLQVIQTSNNFSSIVGLGERHLYCLQDNGLLKFVKKLDYMPLCFWAYLIGWYYEPGARLLIMVASDDSKLMIYENTTLLWSCQLTCSPISIRKGVFEGMPGGVVTLSFDGVIYCCYLGTEPDLTPSVPQLQQIPEYNVIQRQLEEAEGKLNELMENEENNANPFKNTIILNITIGNANTETKPPFCPLKICIKQDNSVQNIQISYFCEYPLIMSETSVTLENMKEDTVIETTVFLSSGHEVASSSIKILFVITDTDGRTHILDRQLTVPLNLIYKLCEFTRDLSSCRILLGTNLSIPDLRNILNDFHNDLSVENEEGITLALRDNNESILSILKSKESNSIEIQSNNFSDMNVVVDYLVSHLQSINNELDLKFDGAFSIDLMQNFTKSIESHANERLKLAQFQYELSCLQNQFTLIQKQLLVQFGALPPGDCSSLEFLLKDTNLRITECVNCIIQSKQNVLKEGCKLTSIGRLVIFVMKMLHTNKESLELLNEAFAFDTIYDDYQEWEEAVSMAIQHILSTMFSKSEKDREKMVAVNDQGILKHNNMRRFVKLIRVLFDRLLSQATHYEDDIKENDEQSTKEVKRTKDIDDNI